MKLNILGASFSDPYTAVARSSDVGGTTCCSGCVTRLFTVKPKASIGRQYRSRGDGIVKAMQCRGLVYRMVFSRMGSGESAESGEHVMPCILRVFLFLSLSRRSPCYQIMSFTGVLLYSNNKTHLSHNCDILYAIQISNDINV